MVFSSAIFMFLFLPIVLFLNLFLNLFLKGQGSNILLLVASLFFYAWGEPKFVLVMLLSILINWIIGYIISRVKDNKKKVALFLGIVVDLAILLFFKYSMFIVSNVNALMGASYFEGFEVKLPIGISFFTFQAISYIIDVYRGEVDASNSIINTALYISFFPQLIAGPIVKYKDINKQIEKRTVSWTNISDGFRRFIYGLSKKVLIANVMGLCVDKIYSYDINQIDQKAAWIGAICYTFQIYYDFSGYSDMAIGLGKMFGFDILENFNYPYLSKSISEFWRRWHISLGTWFKEYVYIPLGGNKKGTKRTYINLIIVFFLTGLWHGADWSFVLWGLYHGLFSIIERLKLKKILEKSKVFSRVYCFFIVVIGWVLFRADTTEYAIKYIARMFYPFNGIDNPIQLYQYADLKTLFIGICAILGMGVIQKCVSVPIGSKWKDSVSEALYCVVLLFLSIATIVSDTYNPFIYFQF
jgi:alginate O-acetyltransferase complex protein AlgI